MTDEANLSQPSEEEVDPQRPDPSADPDQELTQFAARCAKELVDGRCSDVVLLDVRGISPVTHMILIGTGTSDRQIQAVARDLATFGKHNGFERFGEDRDEASTWIVVDFVDVMVHLFEPSTRSHYDLEMMWGDAPQIDWQALLAEQSEQSE